MSEQHQHQHRPDTEGEAHHEHGHKRLVRVTVDNHEVELDAGNYVVSAFKQLVGIAADRLLDKVVGPGKFVQLQDTETIHIAGGECFVSYVKQGSSS